MECIGCKTQVKVLRCGGTSVPVRAELVAPYEKQFDPEKHRNHKAECPNKNVFDKARH